MKNPILVSGAHRSGTTWIGKMIALANNIAYVHEPFNLITPTNKGLFKYWFTYVNNENSYQYEKEISNTINLKYNYFSDMQINQFIKKEFTNNLILQLTDLYKHLFNYRVLVKDPIAIFSAEWLANHFDMSVIILIRHPAAFVNSLLDKNWSFDFSNLLQQENLIKNHLHEFKDEMVLLSKNNSNIIDQACLLWRIIYTTIYKYQVNYKEWLFIRHEDISRNPISEFQRIYKFLGLNLTSEIKIKLHEHSHALITNESLIQRNSLNNIKKWKQNLSAKDINTIRSKVNDVSQLFYEDSDW